MNEQQARDYIEANNHTSVTGPPSRTTSYQYFPDGSIKQVAHVNGTTTDYARDNARRLKEVWHKAGANTIGRHTYTLDKNGNRTQADETVGGASTTLTYTYDGVQRLTGHNDGTTTSSYAYSAAENRTQLTRGGTTTAYTYDRADRLQSATTGGTPITYGSDASGNVTSRGADSYSYDQANRLITATVAGTTQTYAYNGDGQRITRTTGVSTTRYLWDINRDLAVVLEDGGRRYVWGPSLAYATDISGTNLVHVYHGDGQGSVRQLTNAAGQTTDTYQSDPWGNPGAGTGTSTQPFGYTGQLWDPQTKLLHLRAREYDPETGRFVQRDRVFGRQKAPSTLNRYAYAVNNPVNFVDPSGNGHCS